MSLFHMKCIFLANPVHAPFCHSGSRLYRTGETNPRRHQLTFCANASSFPSWQVRLASLTGTFFAGIPSFHFLLVQKSYFLIREERMKEEEEGTNANFVLSPPTHIPSPPLKKEPYWISTNCFIFWVASATLSFFIAKPLVYCVARRNDCAHILSCEGGRNIGWARRV